MIDTTNSRDLLYVLFVIRAHNQRRQILPLLSLFIMRPFLKFSSPLQDFDQKDAFFTDAFESYRRFGQAVNAMQQRHPCALFRTVDLHPIQHEESYF